MTPEIFSLRQLCEAVHGCLRGMIDVGSLPPAHESVAEEFYGIADKMLKVNFFTSDRGIQDLQNMFSQLDDLRTMFRPEIRVGSVAVQHVMNVHRTMLTDYLMTVKLHAHIAAVFASFLDHIAPPSRVQENLILTACGAMSCSRDVQAALLTVMSTTLSGRIPTDAATVRILQEILRGER